MGKKKKRLVLCKETVVNLDNQGKALGGAPPQTLSCGVTWCGEVCPLTEEIHTCGPHETDSKPENTCS
jgi:hypothetical protein